MKGVIKKLNEKGFGFISVEGQKDVFFHANDCTAGNFKEMNEGDAVSFETAPSEKGPKAVNVVLIGMDQEAANTDMDAAPAAEAEESKAA